MPPRLIRATAVTVGILLAMLAVVILPILVVSAGTAIVPLAVIFLLGVFVAGVGFAVGPWFFDLWMRFMMRVERMSLDEFEERYPAQGALIREVCQRHDLPLPQMRLIESMTPNAFTFGSVPSNARIAVSSGLLHYLDDDESNSVMAHELGHIKHWDFALMSFLQLLVLLLEWTADYAQRLAQQIKLNDKKGKAGSIVTVLFAVAVLARIFAWVGSYLVLYVSRIREYMADIFAAQNASGVRAMQRALIRIAYGVLDHHRLKDSQNPNVLVGIGDQFGFLSDAAPPTNWTEDAAAGGEWQEADASTSAWARKVFVVPEVATVSKTAWVREGWFKKRPPTSTEELPDMTLRLGEEGITKAYLNGEPIDIEGGLLSKLGKGDRSVSAALLRDGENVLAMEIDPEQVGKTGSFRVQLGWPSNTVYPWRAERDVKQLCNVAQLCVASPAPPSVAPSLSSEDKVLPHGLTDLLLFDIASPWAKVIELGSTHPLTGKRLLALNDTTEDGQDPFIEMDYLNKRLEGLDHGRLRGSFTFEAAIYMLPLLAMAASVLVAMMMLAIPPLLLLVPAVFLGMVGAASALKGLYRYSRGGGFERIGGFFPLLSDPYASPLRGRPIVLRGHVIGKGEAGSLLSENIMLADADGNLMYLNYEALIPVIGNAWFGFRTLPTLLGESVVVTGWYRRGASSIVDIHDLIVEDGRVYASSVRFWALAGGVSLMSLAVAWAVFVASAGTLAPLALLFAVVPAVALVVAKVKSSWRKSKFTPEEIERFVAEQSADLSA